MNRCLQPFVLVVHISSLSWSCSDQQPFRPPAIPMHIPSHTLLPMQPHHFNTLISHADQIISQRFHHIRRRPGLHMLGVVCHQYRLRCLHNHHTFLALQYQILVSTFSPRSSPLALLPSPRGAARRSWVEIKMEGERWRKKEGGERRTFFP